MLTNVVQTDMGLECSENALLDCGEKLTVSVRAFRALFNQYHKAFLKRKSPMQRSAAQGFELTIFS